MSNTETTTTETDIIDCEGCGADIYDEGNVEMIRMGTLEEPPEYVTLCDECYAHAIEPDDYPEPFYDDPALDYAYDPFCD